MFKMLKSSFNTSLAQLVSAYLAIIRCIKIVGKMTALLYIIISHVDTFSLFYDTRFNNLHKCGNFSNDFNAPDDSQIG
jgi:hypothetical protein